jgi:hypothetical protein
VARGRGALLLLLCGVLALALAAPARAGYDCALWASSAGSDGNPGTREAPLRTVNRLVSVLHPGQTGCLQPGSIFNEHVVVSQAGRPSAPIRVLTPGGKRAVITGVVRVARSAHDVILANLVVLGDGAAVDGIVSVRASRVQLLRLAISGPGFLDRRIACVTITGGANGVVVEHDEIHDCTRASVRGAFAAGIAVVHASGTQILDNYVSHVPGDGIALAPDADRTFVSHNVVDGNVSALFIGGDRRHVSSGNTIVDNVLSFSGKWNVHSSWSGSVGGGNAVTRNCIWRGFRGNVAGTGFASYANLFVSPGFRNRPSSLTLGPGRCFAKRPRPYQLDRTNLGLPWPKLPRFLVHWTVRALPSRVQVVSLALLHLDPGAHAQLRCRTGCSVNETVVANDRGSASSLQLPGLWLPRGALLEVRERRYGAVGSFASVRVLGLPLGLAVTHACLPPFGQLAPVPCGRYA